MVGEILIKDVLVAPRIFFVSVSKRLRSVNKSSNRDKQMTRWMECWGELVRDKTAMAIRLFFFLLLSDITPDLHCRRNRVWDKKANKIK